VWAAILAESRQQSPISLGARLLPGALCGLCGAPECIEMDRIAGEHRRKLHQSFCGLAGREQ